MQAPSVDVTAFLFPHSLHFRPHDYRGNYGEFARRSPLIYSAFKSVRLLMESFNNEIYDNVHATMKVINLARI